MGLRPAVRQRSRRGGRDAPPLAWLALLLAGCALRQTVVLMPDPDGHLGMVEVTTAGGSQRLSGAGEMTTVCGATAPPSAATTADPDWIAETFAEALAAEPAPVLYFEAGTTNLVPSSRAAIRILAETLMREGRAAHLSGHTDSIGADRLNEQLSLRRAERIRELLIEAGVAAEQLTVSFHGERAPAIPTSDGVAEPRNRRVEANVR